MAVRTPTESSYYKVITFIVIALLLASCGTGRSTVTRKKQTSATLQEEIIAYGRQYLGKPYRYAGRGPRAFDCSGYTAFIFKEFGYRLDPSSAGQDKQFPAVSRKEELHKGDLVFFEGRAKNGKVGHVGIVIETRSDGEFRFIHASTGEGVIITSSTEYYWASRYLRGGRVLEKNIPATAASTRAGNRNDHRYTAAVSNEKTGRMTTPVMAPPAKNKVSVAEDALKSTVGKEIDVERAEENVLLVQRDSSKNRPLKEKSSDEKRNDTVSIKNNAVIARDESLEIPKPVEAEMDKSTPASHTVKMGETLYALSRQYGCTVDQLRSWNPQLGGVLKAGDLIRVSE
jgi:cell wall-associated NlpC family hydrolase